VIRGGRDGILLEVAMEWTDSYHETMLCLPTHPRGTADPPRRLARRDPHRRRPSQRQRIAKKEKVALTGETCARFELHPVGQGARPEILLADQGQAVSSRFVRRSKASSAQADAMVRWEHPADAEVVAKVVEAAAARAARARN
jgi:DNA gyrase subunit B